MKANVTAATRRPVLIMAGGTGGHVFPALAVARDLMDRGVPVVWMGTRSGLEATVVPAAGIPVEWVSVAGLRGKALGKRLRAPFMLAHAGWQALRILRRQRPRVVLGMGGFVTGPGGVVARMLGTPLCIQEQNAVAGLTNRLLSRVATRVMQAFPGSFPPDRKAIVTGNPVRSDIAGLPAPEQRFQGREGRLRLLVLGGSLGARALNETVPKALAMLAAELRPHVRHQVGKRNLEEAQQNYREAGATEDVELMPFVDDMAEAYGWADLVLCRAGALTVSELAAAGLGAILVPYPHAVDDHQTHNAGFLVDGGAGLLISQNQLSPERLADLLRGFARDRPRLLEMAVAARRLANLQAARLVAEICLDVAEHPVSEERG
jgi:UDP-N-acetylglucosamine--N-acetylmuramyl-(pentapeptide) pyrophosphoryl-undecaprenol N-acetylglucosamine transferase